MTWSKVEYDYRDEGTHFAVFSFRTAADAKEFVRLAKIGKDVDDELLLYGNGVLRTIKRGSKNGTKRLENKKIRTYSHKQMR